MKLVIKFFFFFITLDNSVFLNLQGIQIFKYVDRKL